MTKDFAVELRYTNTDQVKAGLAEILRKAPFWPLQTVERRVNRLLRKLRLETRFLGGTWRPCPTAPPRCRLTVIGRPPAKGDGQ